MRYYYITGKNKLSLVFGKTVYSIPECLEYAKVNKLETFAIYKCDEGFHSTAQEEYLIGHHNDTYWINRGIESKF